MLILGTNFKNNSTTSEVIPKPALPKMQSGPENYPFSKTFKSQTNYNQLHASGNRNKIATSLSNYVVPAWNIFFNKTITERFEI